MMFGPKYFSAISELILELVNKMGFLHGKPQTLWSNINVRYQGYWGAYSTYIPKIKCLCTMKLEMQSATKVTFKTDFDIFVWRNKIQSIRDCCTSITHINHKNTSFKMMWFHPEDTRNTLKMEWGPLSSKQSTPKMSELYQFGVPSCAVWLSFLCICMVNINGNKGNERKQQCSDPSVLRYNTTDTERRGHSSLCKAAARDSCRRATPRFSVPS